MNYDKIKSMLLRMFVLVHTDNSGSPVAVLVDNSGKTSAYVKSSDGVTIGGSTFAWNSQALENYLANTNDTIVPSDNSAVFKASDSVTRKIFCEVVAEGILGIQILRFTVLGKKLVAYRLGDMWSLGGSEAGYFRAFLQKVDIHFNCVAVNYSGKIVKPTATQEIAYYECFKSESLDPRREILGRLFCAWQESATRESSGIRLDLTGETLYANTTGLSMTSSFGEDHDIDIDWEDIRNSEIDCLSDCAYAYTGAVIVEIPNWVGYTVFSNVGTPVPWLMAIKVNGKIAGFRIQSSYCVVYRNMLSELGEALSDYKLQWMTLSVSNGKFHDATPGKAQYMLLHVPEGYDPNYGVSVLQRTIENGNYKRMIRALESLDKELPARLNVVLELLED